MIQVSFSSSEGTSQLQRGHQPSSKRAPAAKIPIKSTVQNKVNGLFLQTVRLIGIVHKNLTQFLIRNVRYV